MPPTTPEPIAAQSTWWETYVIRYFVGTVVGGAILLYLNNSSDSTLKNSILPGITTLADLDVGALVVIAAAGLAYCYLASAPILVFHASRSMFVSSIRYKLVNWILVVFGVGLAIATTILCNLSDVDRTILSIALLIGAIGLQTVLLAGAMWNNGRACDEFYKKLTLSRAELKPENQEYKQSYRHLREHGNAFFILLFEGVLGVILAGLPNAGIALISLLMWIVPAAFIWAMGTQLEARFAGYS